MPLLVHTRHFPPPRHYHAITLFPFIFFNGDKLSPSEIRHEVVHLYQQAALLVVGFYFLYLFFWLVGLLRYRNHHRAYREIPFERSAYHLENLSAVSPLKQSFHWLRCL